MLYPRTIVFAVTLFAVILTACGNLIAQDIVVSDSLVISNDTTFDNVTILDGGVLIADAQVNVLANMTCLHVYISFSSGAILGSCPFIDRTENQYYGRIFDPRLVQR